MKQFRVYTVNGKAVTILERFTHTYLVKFTESGKEVSVQHQLVKSFVPAKKKSKKNKPNKRQTKLF